MAKSKTVDNTDEKTIALINEVNKQKLEISKAERPNWLTTCSFSYNENLGGSSANVNLHVEANVKTLLLIVGFLTEKEKYYNEAVNLLKVDSAPSFTWQGFTVKDWIEDIKTRINKIQIATKRKKLELLEARLNTIISPELKAKMELEAIANELGN